jgi:hypothetical protein
MRITIISDVKRVLSGKASKGSLASWLNKMPADNEGYYLLMLAIPVEEAKDYVVKIEERPIANAKDNIDLCREKAHSAIRR